MKLDAPATRRNCGPILDVLRPLLPGGAVVLEIASGTGQHAAFFARALPQVTWHPSALEPEHLASIEAWRAESEAPNLRPAVALDAEADAWPLARADAVVCINMVHIAPWSATEGLVRGAARGTAATFATAPGWSWTCSCAAAAATAATAARRSAAVAMSATPRP